MSAILTELEFQEKRLEEKIAKLKSGELQAEQRNGDGRQEEAIHRNEAQLRQIKKDIADRKAQVPAMKEAK